MLTARRATCALQKGIQAMITLKELGPVPTNRDQYNLPLTDSHRDRGGVDRPRDDDERDRQRTDHRAAHCPRVLAKWFGWASSRTA